MTRRWFGCGWVEDGVVTPHTPGGMVNAMRAELSDAAPDTPTLAALIEARGLSQAELARRLGISQPRLHHYIRGSRRLPLAMAPTVAAELGVSTDTIARACFRPRPDPTSGDAR